MYRIIDEYGSDLGAYESVTFVKLSDSGTLVKAEKNEAIGVFIKGGVSSGNDGTYALIGHDELYNKLGVDHVAVIEQGDILNDRLYNLISGSSTLSYSNAATADCIAIRDTSNKTGNRMTLGNLVNYVKAQLGGFMTPQVVVSAPTGSTVTATLGDTVIGSTEAENDDGNPEWVFNLPSHGFWTIVVKNGSNTAAKPVNAVSSTTKYTVSITDTDWLPEMNRSGGLNAYTWEEVGKISASGLGDTYFNVGDTHSVELNGTAGTLALNTTLYSYILDFNHDKSTASGSADGITFGTFKTAATGGVDVVLVDSKYNSTSTDGTKYFNMNHWGNYNHGGWKGCDLRYDVLGSTNQQPSGYGTAVASGRVGYDANSTTATSPVTGTLMSCLPEGLRAVMKPMCVYSDNVGGGSGSVLDNVSASIDYLPLLSEFEIFGTPTYSNSYCQNKQKQYAYYANGNSRVRYRHSSTSSAAYWWERSPTCDNASTFCFVGTDGSAYSYIATTSLGLAPAFKV